MGIYVSQMGRGSLETNTAGASTGTQTRNRPSSKKTASKRTHRIGPGGLGKRTYETKQKSAPARHGAYAFLSIGSVT